MPESDYIPLGNLKDRVFEDDEEPLSVKQEQATLGQEGPWSSDCQRRVVDPAISTSNTIKLTLFWFGYQFTWFLITIVILPSQVSTITLTSSESDSVENGLQMKGSALAIINLSSGLLYLFFSPVFGAFNDKSRFTFSAGHGLGKRKPWILIGAFGMLFCLFLLSGNLSLFVYSLVYLLLNLSSILCSIPFNGLVADMTHSSQNAKVSSIMGAMNLFGYLFGAIVGTAYSSIPIYTLYFIISLVFLSCTLITCTIPIPPEPHLFSNLVTFQEQEDTSRINYFRLFQEIISPLLTHPSFRLVFISRFLFQLGIASIQSFLQYWIQDCVLDAGMDATTAVSLAMIPNLLIAPIASLLTPFFAGSGRRKVVVYFAAVCMTVACLLMMFTSQFSFAILVSSIFGLGYGPFMSTEFAMLMDVLPSHKDVARDMSLWHTALILPQILSTPLAGYLLDYFQEIGLRDGGVVHCLGYKVINSFTIFYLLLGSIVTAFIQGIS